MPESINKRKPAWLKVTAFRGKEFDRINRKLKELNLSTVCQAANCPNRGECFNRGTATFLIMGPNCTRNCRFCDIQANKPKPLDPEEPSRLAMMASELKLKHVVVTSVTRDDLPDGGANHFAETVHQLRLVLPKATIELLTPDFRDCPGATDIIIKAHPDVFNHNVETVPRLYQTVRPGAEYQRSLDLLKYVADNSDIPTKSGIMVGLGEEKSELIDLFGDLKKAGIKKLTIGQYLQPSKNHHPVARYLPPEEFDELSEIAQKIGIPKIISGPLVRSSYMADMI